MHLWTEKLFLTQKTKKKPVITTKAKKNPLSFSLKAFPMTSSSDALDDKLWKKSLK
jgi:hypothetical protein